MKPTILEVVDAQKLGATEFGGDAKYQFLVNSCSTNFVENICDNSKVQWWGHFRHRGYSQAKEQRENSSWEGGGYSQMQIEKSRAAYF